VGGGKTISQKTFKNNKKKIGGGVFKKKNQKNASLGPEIPEIPVSENHTLPSVKACQGNCST